MAATQMPLSAATIDWQAIKEAFVGKVLEIAESAFLSCLEPNPISACRADELPRIRRALLRARDGELARFREPVTRNAFLIGCLEYSDDKPEEHLLIGYGTRQGRTTKVNSLHHVIGLPNRVHLPNNIAYAMWDHHRQHEKNELLVFHNHPYNPLNLLFDNLPLPSRDDRRVLEARALNPEQLVRTVLKLGRVRFYLGENGFVREFRLPSVVALLDRVRPESA